MQDETPDAPSVLVVDDDDDIRALIIEQLGQESYTLSAAATRQQAVDQIAAHPPDLIILDLSLPDGDGLSLCRQLRDAKYDGAIIMVTARSGPIDRVLGLELGADDYLAKPFEPRELLVRVRKLLARTGRAVAPAGVAKPRIARFGDWRLDLIERRLHAPDGRLVMLSSSSFRLLSKFVMNPNETLSRETLLPERKATVGFDRSIDIQISRLRNKLASFASDVELIQTVRNEGYIFASLVTFE